MFFKFYILIFLAYQDLILTENMDRSEITNKLILLKLSRDQEYSEFERSYIWRFLI